MTLSIQHDGFPASYTVHEALLSKAGVSNSGAAAFAFLSKAGIDLLINDRAFIDMLKRGPFTLVAGLDEVTDEKAVNRLSELESEYKNLSVFGLINSKKGSLFHPKYCFFTENKKGSIIIGSGNLTLGGLRKNSEAFGVIELDEDQIKEVQSTWENWLSHVQNDLYPISDAKVIARAKDNFHFKSKRKKLKVESPEEAIEEKLQAISDKEEDAIDWIFNSNDKVLIAELSKNGERWKQADFGKDIFSSYFGGNIGDSSIRLVLRSAEDDGSLGEIENRPCVSVKSKNYRIELGAASGLTWPETGRPIGVFAKVSNRTFLYSLIMPSELAHQELNDLLISNWSGKATGIKRIVFTANEIKDTIQKTGVGKYLLV